jgi:Glycine cleavage system protein P (pyridoxal-binding), C-terminal domain
MGGDGLRRATQVALLSANYVARRLADHFPTLYTGRNGWSRMSASWTCARWKRPPASVPRMWPSV